jgi:hypothetical protein
VECTSFSDALDRTSEGCSAGLAKPVDGPGKFNLKGLPDRPVTAVDHSAEGSKSTMALVLTGKLLTMGGLYYALVTGYSPCASSYLDVL